ncbi:MAG: GGDEF domain-containing protein [Proteobacteria bacterium]|nr:GGDEF domain-containing protein [Pseudomonadota bacterium]
MPRSPHRLAGRPADWRHPTGGRLAASLLLLGALILAAAVLVYLTGGTKLVYAHVLYVPIVIGAFLFGPLGGVTAGAAAAFAVGPLMPLDVAAGVPQPTVNWLARTGFFLLVGGLAGALFEVLGRQIEAIRTHGLRSPITRLPNLAALRADLRAMLGRAIGAQVAMEVAVLRVDRLRELVSAVGFDYGHRLLRGVAAHLRDREREIGRLYHIQSNGFAVVLQGRAVGRAEETAGQLLAALQKSVVIDGQRLAVEGQVGIARFPEHGATVDEILQAASVAADAARAAGRFWSVYDDDEAARFKDRRVLAMQIRDAVADRQMLFHFQPKVSLADRRCVGAEALIRWRHPTRGLLSPGRFIELAERTGVVEAVSEWVLAEALDRVAAWSAGGRPVPVAVNLSIRDIEDAAIVRKLDGLIAARGIRPDLLEIEVTESAILLDPGRAKQVLHEIGALGVRTAIDDFGSGQTSLSYLNELPVRTLKLDRSFTLGLEADWRKYCIVGSVVRLAHDLGIRVVAEGVETAPVCERLAEVACDEVQGYLIAKPMPEAEFTRWMAGAGGQIGPLQAPSAGLHG